MYPLGCLFPIVRVEQKTHTHTHTPNTHTTHTHTHTHTHTDTHHTVHTLFVENHTKVIKLGESSGKILIVHYECLHRTRAKHKLFFSLALKRPFSIASVTPSSRL